MSFSDPDTLRRRLARASTIHAATVEVGRVEHKQGIIVRLDLVESRMGLENLVAHSLEVAAKYRPQVQRIHEPGWWAGVVCTAAGECGFPAAIQRGAIRSKLHACLIVQPGGFLDAWPSYPLVRVGFGARTLDLRGEECTRFGPSDEDLQAYLDRTGLDSDIVEARSMFDQGVLEWDMARDASTGRLMIVSAGQVRSGTR